MKEKYIDEKVGVWFIFGEHADGYVDISDGTRDVFEHIPKDQAERLCAIQAEFRERLYAETGCGIHSAQGKGDAR